ncbi:MAG: NAD-dependent epimerase/dehydratase family protein [Myxococcales bacterium FL481]|nr:MAG: NAD-dependent epimerase/dehydratase family protein [Myxococcales bacterium FL481]
MTSPGLARAGLRRVLVTGLERRIAAAVIDHLLEHAGVELILGVSRGSCPPWLVGHDPARFVHTTADLRRRRDVENLFLLELVRERSIDSVIHLALEGDPLGYDLERHRFNVASTRQTLAVARANGVGKYVFLSSDAVYVVGPRTDAKVNEDSELNLAPGTHPVVRDMIDAEFLCRAKMDDPDCEIVVLRHSGVIGGGVVSGINLLLESDPPVLPVGFDPLMNPCSVQELAVAVARATLRHGKGVYNVAGATTATLSSLLDAHGVRPRRVPGFALRAINRTQRFLGQTRYHAEYHPGRLHYGLVLDDARFHHVFPTDALRESDAGVES